MYILLFKTKSKGDEKKVFYMDRDIKVKRNNLKVSASHTTWVWFGAEFIIKINIYEYFILILMLMLEVNEF